MTTRNIADSPVLDFQWQWSCANGESYSKPGTKGGRAKSTEASRDPHSAEYECEKNWLSGPNSRTKAKNRGGKSFPPNRFSGGGIVLNFHKIRHANVKDQ